MMDFLCAVFMSLLPLFLTSTDKNHATNTTATIPVYGNSAEGYYISISIGTPPQEVNVLVDTGSSNLAVAVTDNDNLSNFFHVDESKSFEKLNETIDVEYTEGSWKGILGRDLITFANGSGVVANVACITASHHFFSNNSRWQGILGLAFNQISKPNPSFTAVFDKLLGNFNMSDVFSIKLCGNEEKNGLLVFGAALSHLYNGDIIYTPIQRKWYYEVALIDMAVAENHWPHDCSQLNEDKTIVDSGTSDLRLPTRVFSWFVQTMSNYANITLPKNFWITDQLICLHGTLSSIFPVLVLTFYREGQPLSLNISPELYLRQVAENGTSNGMKCYKMAVSASEKGTVIGAAILEGFYLVFDRENMAVGFANSSCFKSRSFPRGWVKLSNLHHGDRKKCVFTSTDDQRNSLLQATAYVLVAVSVICFVPLLVMLLHWIWHHLMCSKADSESNRLLDEYH